jgi:hypothetical protein
MKFYRENIRIGEMKNWSWFETIKLKSYNVERKYSFSQADPFIYPFICLSKHWSLCCQHFNLQIKEGWNACKMEEK